MTWQPAYEFDGLAIGAPRGVLVARAATRRT
jgi:hypothetical protein